jgi:hypothetical protein
VVHTPSIYQDIQSSVHAFRSLARENGHARDILLTYVLRSKFNSDGYAGPGRRCAGRGRNRARSQLCARRQFKGEESDARTAVHQPFALRCPHLRSPRRSSPSPIRLNLVWPYIRGVLWFTHMGQAGEAAPSACEGAACAVKLGTVEVRSILCADYLGLPSYESSFPTPPPPIGTANDASANIVSSCFSSSW